MEGEFFIPDCPQDCVKLFRGVIRRKTTKDLDPKNSSTVGDEDFALLRAYFPRRAIVNALEIRLAEFGLDAKWQEAQSLLDKCDSFQRLLDAFRNKRSARTLQRGAPQWSNEFVPALRYIESIQKNEPSQPPQPQDNTSTTLKRLQGRGIFKMDLTLRRESRQSRRKPVKYFESDDEDEPSGRQERRQNQRANMEVNRRLFPDIQSEAGLNSFFLILLSELGELIPDPKSQWILDHMGFSVPLHNGSSYTARTDGILISDSGVVQAIIEVKRALRSHIVETVCKQEAAECALWCKGTSAQLPNLKNQ